MLVLPKDIIDEVMPEEIRKADNFVNVLSKFVGFVYEQRFRERRTVLSETPITFMQNLYDATKVEPKVLR
jgi:DNA excision repair protein ERCC-2